MDDFQSGSIFQDEGTAPQPIVNESSAAPPDESSAVSQTGATAAIEPTQEGQEASPDANAAPKTFNDLPDEEKRRLEESYIEQLKAEEKLPEWFRNFQDNVYKPKLGELTQNLGKWTPLQEQYGDPEKVQELLARTNIGKWGTNQQTGLPEFSTADWAKQTYEQDPKIALQLIKDMAFMPSPNHEGWQFVHDILDSQGIDPTKLDQIREFASNGYQLRTFNSGVYPPPDADELALIPDDLKDTFQALSPDDREIYLPKTYDNDGQVKAKEDALRLKKNDLIRTSTEAEQSAQQKQQEKQQEFQEQQAFRTEVFNQGNQNYEKSGDRILTSFTQSLVKQSGLPELEALNLTNTLLTAIEGRGAAGDLTTKALEAAGIKIDPAIAPLMTELDAVNQRIAYFANSKVTKIAGIAQDVANSERDAAINRSAEIETALVLKGNPVIAQVIEYLAKQKAAPLQAESDALALARQQTGINNNGHPAKIDTGINNADGYDYGQGTIFRN